MHRGGFVTCRYAAGSLCLFFMAGISSCTKKDPQPTSDYFPTASGNTWQYTGDLAYNMVLNGHSKTINGKSFFEADSYTGTRKTTGYLRKENGDYYSHGLIMIGFDSTATGSQDILILKDNVPEGTTWDKSIGPPGSSVLYSFVVDKKDMDYTVVTKTFSHVIKVVMTINVEFYGTYRLAFTQTNYFARGVGLVQMRLEQPGYPIPWLSNISYYRVN